MLSAWCLWIIEVQGIEKQFLPNHLCLMTQWQLPLEKVLYFPRQDISVLDSSVLLESLSSFMKNHQCLNWLSHSSCNLLILGYARDAGIDRHKKCMVYKKFNVILILKIGKKYNKKKPTKQKNKNTLNKEKRYPSQGCLLLSC